MGMRALYLQIDSEDISQVLDNRKAACELLMGSRMRGVDMQTVFGTLGIKNSDLKTMEKMLGPMPSFMNGPPNATAQKKRPTLAIEKSWQAIHFVVQTSTALDRVTDDEFKKKARGADFAGKEIYVYGQDDKLSSEDLEELVHFFGPNPIFFP